MADRPKFGDVPTLFSMNNNPSKTNQTTPATKLEPEFSEQYSTWKNNQSPISNDQMLAKINPIIDSALKTYVGQDVAPSVRLQAKRMAIEGLRSYDPSKAKLKTHLMWHLQGLRRAGMKANQILNVPERVQIDSSHLHTAVSELSDRLGRDPNDNELADYTGLSTKRIQKLRSFKPAVSEGAISDAAFAGEDENVNDPSVVIPGKDSSNAWRGFVYDALDQRSKLIMEHTFGMNGKQILDNAAIARKLRITPARVSQIRTDIQKKLDSRERLGLL